uniref:Phenolphthiocerol/phthiocerol polyketide synthase subunit E n=1 Tax=Kaarinaea lacus PCC 9237 TaxID=3158555 RepID=G9CIA1_9CYAN|nr:NpnA [Nostoc sp. 152]
MQLDDYNQSLANSSNKSFTHREIEVAIQSSLIVDDCVVIERYTENFNHELVAYVVPSGIFTREKLLSHIETIVTDEYIPRAIVLVSTLPLTASGKIDETALNNLEIKDTDLVERWSEEIHSLPEIKQVSVVIQEHLKQQSSLRLSDLLPDWKTVINEENNTSANFHFSRPTITHNPNSSNLAISHGGELKRLNNFPKLLSEALQKTAREFPEKELIYIQSDGCEIIQSYKNLLLDAQKILAGLRKLDLKPLDKVIFQIDISQDFIPAFWGCILGGFIPVPVSVAPAYEQVNSAVNKLHNAWQMLDQPIVLTSSKLAPSIRALPALLNIENFQVETVDNLRQNQPDSNIHQSQEDDLALLLLTSGSTGFPKGVMLNHRNLLSMTAGTAQMNNFDSQDIVLNWMPLEHVGAIVFLGLMAVDLGCQQIHVSTEYILQNPIRWLELIQQYKASISWAPNFAFSLLNERANDINQRSWDLSSMKFLVNAGEQIVPKTARSFLKLFQTYNLPPTAIHPAFGMSETCSGITWSDGFSLSTSSDDMSFVELGPPIPGASIRITDENNQIVTEGVIGKFQVKGSSVTSGYYKNPQRNREAFTEDGWFNTGDIGYLKAGRIVLTGRDKDDIIINGINYYSHEIESLVEEVEGVEISYTAACAVRLFGNNADQLAIFFSSAVSEPTLLKELLKKIRGAVVKNIGVNPNYIIPVKKNIIPKTAIGKIQRPQLSRMFEAGEFDNIIQQFGINLDNPNLLPNWFYRQIWRQKAPVTQISAINGNFLVFIDQLGVGEYLGAEFQKHGQKWVGVEVGVDFRQLSSNRYEIAPNNPEHYQLLLSALAANNFQIDNILHLWTYDARISEISSLESLEQAQTLGVYSLLFLVKALAKIEKFDRAIALTTVSSYTQFTSHSDEIAYEKSPLVGLLKVIDQEIPGLTSRHLDLSVDEPAVNAGQILQEISVLPCESEVAYRQGQRWIPRLEKVDFSPQSKPDFAFKSGGMYLISGGLGGVGVEIAKYLLKHYKARLLLVGRTHLPEKSDLHTDAEKSSVVAQKIAVYEELEQLGGKIIYEAVDVCDLPRLQQIVEQAQSRWGCELDGVLHLAGTYQERSLLEENHQSWSTAIRAKVSGAWVLNQLLKDYPQAAMISFSSVSRCLGGATVGTYVAANQFLESFAHYQRSQGLKSYCFSWSLWDAIGISQDQQRSKLAQTKGYCAISARQGLYSLLIGLHHNQAHLLIGLDGSNRHIRGYVEDTYALEKLTAYFTVSDNSSIEERLSQLRVRDRFGTPSTCNFVQLQKMPLTTTGIIDRDKLIKGDLREPSNEQAQPTSDIERQVAQIWQEVLGLEEVGIDDNFFELGGHSLLLVQAQSKLQESFQIPVSIVDMFKYPSISALAKYLSQGQTESPAVLQGQKRAKVRSSRQSVGNADIAVIGMSCRFPGANNIDEFWQNLANGVESISFFTEAEIIAAGVDPTLVKNPNYVKAKPILSDVESFDADFFGYSSREAELMDPQQRLLLECAWESLENAGYNPLTYNGAIGIYAGAVMNTYLLNNVYPNRHQLDVNDNLQVATMDSMGGLQLMVANDKDYLTTRISYKLNLTGPSVNVQTACSTSLVAIHMACANLLSGESDMVLAGGVSINAPQKVGHLYQEGMIVTPDGHCRAFDAQAQGTIFGSGVGLVVLKRLQDAIADQDHIYAVVKGSATNNDGGTKVGYMAPNGDGQTAVVTEAMTMAGVDAETIGYVEAHGTGTPMGDPIEIGGLTQAFRASTQSKNFCGIGSVKTNVGHLQIASGVVGFIKTVLSLYHKQIPPSLHFEQPNPQLDLPNTPFYVNTTLKDWHTQDYPRRAGVNSLGIGGANAHVILEEAPEPLVVNNEFERPYHLLTLSAKSEEALAQLRHRYEEFLISNTDVSIADICYTANVGRSHFNHRLAIVANSREQLLEQLASHGKTSQIGKKPPKIAFLFTGQGSQYINMGRELYETQPLFRQTLEQCNEILRPYLEHSLLEVLYPQGKQGSRGAEGAEEAGEQENNHSSSVAAFINQTAYTQPAIFAVEYALYQLWKSWGIEPDVVMGHSVGEYVAACIAGVFSLEDGLKLIAKRGQLMQQLPDGGEMVSLIASEEQVREIIAPFHNKVSIAAINSSESIVISGAREDIASLKLQGIKTKQLQVSHAFHSPLMTPILAEFEQVAKQVTYNQPQIPIISNLTGQLADEKITTAEYWVNHISQTVQFALSMETLQNYGIFLEIGSKPTLLGMGRECLPDSESQWLPSLRPGVSEWEQILLSLAKLYVAGVQVNWSEFERDYARQKVALPNYPFQRQRYWIENIPSQNQVQKSPKLHPLIDKKLQLPLSKEILFESQFSTVTLPFLAEHQVYNQIIVPGASHLSLLLGAANLTFGSEACLLENIVFPQALAIPQGEARTLQLVLSPQGNSKSFQLISFDSTAESEINQWLVHATGKISPSIPTTSQNIDIQQIKARCTQQITALEIYQNWQKREIQLGASFQWLDSISFGDGEALAQIKWLSVGNEQQEYQLYPGLIDSCLQLTGIFFPSEDTFVPFAIESFRFYQRPQIGQLWCHAVRRQQHNSIVDKIIVDIKLFDIKEQLIAEIVGMEAKKVTRQLLLPSHNVDITDWLYEVAWQEVDKKQSTPNFSGNWLIFADSQGLGQQLSEQLQNFGVNCTLVSAGVKYEKIEQQHYHIDSSQAEHFQKLLYDIGSQEQQLGIIYLWGIAQNENNLPDAELKNCGSVLHLVQALTQVSWQVSPHLWLVTQGTQAISSISEPLQLSGSSLWGLGRVIATEHPEFQCVRLDLSLQGTQQQHLQALLLELSAADKEDQIAIRQNKRYVARLVRRVAKQQLSPQPVQLKISEYGVLDNLSLVEMKRRSPQINEVEIQVQVGAVNFRDVLNALGMLKEYYAEKMGITQASDLTFGFECAGIITAVGDNVNHLQVGDEVVAWVTTHDALSSFVTLPATTVVKKPTNLSFSQAATTPLAFLTAQYGLHELAKIQPGERVLIHAATGGVGQAAVQIALSAGAEVFATASIHKWEFLKSMGVKYVMNSRSLEFVDEVMDLTQGQGVDVVLNSLNGEFIPKNLQVLSHGGRFVEIGKVGIWDESQVRAIREDVSYFPFDLGEVHQKHPSLIPSMLQQLMAQLQTGTLRPLPQTVFSAGQVVDAFRYMATAKHIGKVLISMPPMNQGQLSIQTDASYLITGGNGALGLEVAGWLVEKGARHLVLTGRRDLSVAAKERISSFEQLGVKVLVVKADVSEAAQMLEVLDKINSQLPPLRGIIHAAGVLDDGVLKQQSLERFRQVMAPKVSGAWNLHTLTQHLPLDFFVCFSSISSLFGSGGQGNYAAANALMDGLAHYRQSLGLPGLSINWGAWSQVGMAARLDSGDQNRLQSLGIGTIAPQQGLAVLEQLLSQSSAQVTAIPIDWGQFLSKSASSSPFFANFTQTIAKIADKSEFRAQLAAAKNSDRKKLLIDHLCSQVAQVLGRNLSTQDLQQGFFELGIDSLTAVELRNRLQNSLDYPLPSSLTFDYPTVTVLADYLSQEVLAIADASIAQPVSEFSDLSIALDELSESEIEKLLAQELAIIQEGKGLLSENSVNTDRQSLMKKALLELKEMKSQLEAVERAKKEPIAIVGMGCRFPGGANNPEAFWQLLRDGVDAVTEVPANRWDINAFYDPDPETPGKMYSRYGGFVSQLEEFDAQFFGIAPREAVSLDPQQRLLLEVSWEALENASIKPSELLGTQAGVFVGICGNDYLQRLLSREATEIDAYQVTGNAHSVAAGRLSYILGLNGPSLAVDTACSSSLVAVHLACQSLRHQESDLAIAGGVNLLLSSEISINFSKARMLAPDGRCKTFDAAADGYVRGEGCGVIILKRLSDAIKDKNQILALIRGSAVNQDGRSSGLTVPNGSLQQAVIRQALANGGVEPSEISYLEAHGTGTSLGDPIEVGAMSAVFGKNTDQPLTIGSVKTNIGHLEAAAGIAGIIKVVLQMQHQEIAPHLHFQDPSPHINWENLPLIVPTQKTNWQTAEKPLLAGVSSFGFSGTNAHVVLEQPPTIEPITPEVERPLHLLTLSAKTQSALEQLAFGYQNYIQTHSDVAIADICYTANVGREHFNHRLAIVVNSREQLLKQLTTKNISNHVKQLPKIAFLFTGQGSQYINMGRELYETQPLFRQTLEQCNEILRPYLEHSLLEVLYTEQNSSLLNQTSYTQPAIFAVEYALYQLWKSWGIEPDVVIGHSVGEYVAATVAGVLSLEDGLKLIAQRGQLMQQLPDGGEMVSLIASEEQVRKIIAPFHKTISIAAINSSESIVISGAREDIALLNLQGIKTKQLQVSHAFHSPLMTPMLAEFEQVAKQVTYNQPQIPIISNLTGQLADEKITTAEYWVNHISQTVQFALSMETLQNYGIFLEIGSKPTLLGMGRECLPDSESQWLPSLRPGVSEWEQILLSLAKLYVAGVQVNWSEFERDYARQKVALPNYPFQRQRYWMEAKKVTRQLLLPSHNLDVTDWLYEIDWQAVEKEQSTANLRGNWLIFADTQGLGKQLGEQLQNLGGNYTLVSAGVKYENVDRQHYQIDPSQAEHFQKLLYAIGSQQKLGIIYLWSITQDESNLPDAELKNCGSILHLVQALAQFSWQVSPHLWLVTQGTQAISSISEPLQLCGSSLWGLGRVIATEHPEFQCVRLDLSVQETQQQHLQALLLELSAAEKEDQIAIRQGKRYVARLVRRVAKEQLSPQPVQLSIQADASYLITGGNGGLGLEVAGWLVEKGVRHLVLTGRSPVSVAAKERISSFEQLGVEVLVVKADVSQVAEMVEVLEKINTQLPPLRGIIHAAGVLDDGVLKQQSLERFRQVMAPKVSGAWNLHTLTKHLPLDFFVCFSSISSLFGSGGQGNYAAANALMDGLAHYRQSLGLPGLSINWGAWSQVGMAARLDSGEQNRLQGLGIGAIAPEKGLAVLEQLLSQSSAQVTAIPIDWGKFLSKSATSSPFFANFTDTFVKSAEKPQFRTFLEESNPSDRQKLLIDYLCSRVTQVLGGNLSQTLDIEQGFSELGMDSLTATELRNSLQKSLACSLPSSLTFDYPTVTKLADYLAQEVFLWNQAGELDVGSQIMNHQHVLTNSELEDLSEHEAEALLLEKLASINY